MGIDGILLVLDLDRGLGEQQRGRLDEVRIEDLGRFLARRMLRQHDRDDPYRGHCQQDEQRGAGAQSGDFHARSFGTR